MIVVVTGSDSSSGRVSERRLVKMEMTACFWSDGCGNFVRFSNDWSVSIFFFFGSDGGVEDRWGFVALDSDQGFICKKFFLNTHNSSNSTGECEKGKRKRFLKYSARLEGHG